jgi:hypothetical protein
VFDPGVQLGERQCAGRSVQRGGVRVRGDLGGEERRKGLGFARPVGVVPAGEHGLPLGRGEQVHGGQRAVGVGAEPAEEAHEPGGESFDGVGIEEVGGVFDGAVEGGGAVAFAGFEEVEREVELGTGARRPGLLNPASGQRVPMLVGDHDLEQRVAGGGALRVQRLDERVEWQLGMGEGPEVGVAYPPDELPQGGVARQVRPEHQGVDEEADQLLQGGIVPPGDRHTERDVGAGAHAGQQRRHRGVEHHERRGAGVAGQRRHLPGEAGRQGEVDGSAVEAGHRRAGPVGGQRQLFGDPVERRPPPGSQAAGGAFRIGRVGEPLTLPPGVVAVGDGQR